MEKTGRTPSKVQTDLGTEFKNKIFENELRKGKIQFYVTFSETKAAVVERFNRTLKGKMWKYFTHANTFRYIDILPQLLEGYNATPHSSLDGLCPVQINQTNQPKIWRKTFAEKRVPTIFKYKVNDTVRITRDKNLHEKGYTHNWSEEYFEIHQRLSRSPPVYRLKDLNGEKIKGIFYEPQLQKVKPGDIFPITKVIRHRGDNALVKWRGWPESFNSWIPVSDLEKYG